MTFGLVGVGYSLPFGQAVKLIFFAPCYYTEIWQSTLYKLASINFNSWIYGRLEDEEE